MHSHKFPYKVYVKAAFFAKNGMNRWQWCVDNFGKENVECQHDGKLEQVAYMFKNEGDATLFALKWKE